MGKRLSDNLSSLYLGAANKLKPKKAKKKIVAYVESYDDVAFWRSVFDDLNKVAEKVSKEIGIDE